VLTGGSRSAGHRADGPRCVGQPYTLWWRTTTGPIGMPRIRRMGTRTSGGPFRVSAAGRIRLLTERGIGVTDHGGESPPIVPDRSSVHPS